MLSRLEFIVLIGTALVLIIFDFFLGFTDCEIVVDGVGLQKLEEAIKRAVSIVIDDFVAVSLEQFDGGESFNGEVDIVSRQIVLGDIHFGNDNVYGR